MDETRRPDEQPTSSDPSDEDRHGTPFGLESSIPGVSVHGAEDEQDRAPSAKDSGEAKPEGDDEAPPLV